MKKVLRVKMKNLILIVTIFEAVCGFSILKDERNFTSGRFEVKNFMERIFWVLPAISLSLDVKLNFDRFSWLKNYSAKTRNFQVVSDIFLKKFHPFLRSPRAISCGDLLSYPENDPESSIAPGFASGTYLDDTTVFPGTANFAKCDADTLSPARISTKKTLLNQGSGKKVLR